MQSLQRAKKKRRLEEGQGDEASLSIMHFWNLEEIELWMVLLGEDMSSLCSIHYPHQGSLHIQHFGHQSCQPSLVILSEKTDWLPIKCCALT